MQLKEQYIHGVNHNQMIIEIICKLTAIKDTDVVTSEQVLAWAIQVEAQRTQTAI